MAPLHPRFKAYGFSEADADLVRSFQFSARRAGWSESRIEEAFGWFKELAPAMAAMPPEARIQSFTEYTEARGWQAREVETAVGWFDTTAAALERGQAPELPPPQTREQDATRSAEIAEVMRADPAKYWGDSRLQDELYDINARLVEGGDAPPAAEAPAAAARGPSSPTAPAGVPPGGGDRRGAIETMMRDEPAKYWASSAVQAEYRGLVSGGSPGEPPGAIPGGADAGGADAGAAAAEPT